MRRGYILAGAVALAVFLTVALLGGGETTWDYCSMTVDPEKETLEAALDRHGAEGWELVLLRMTTMHPQGDDGAILDPEAVPRQVYVALLKRAMR